MSGGHFDNNCFSISRFASELEHELNVNDSDETDDWGDRIGKGYSKDTVDLLRQCLVIITLAGELAKEIEWLYSGDHGEETFMEIMKERSAC